MTDFASYLREAREAAGLNQSELAEKVGLTGSYISVLESRKKPPPSDSVLTRLAKALGRPAKELLEVAHLDRTPEDIRSKIRALDRRLRLERKTTQRLLTDILPGSLWHFWRVRGYQEYGLEKLRLDGRKKRILRKVLRRIGHLTSRDDFVEESRVVLETLPEDERTVLAEVVPELVVPPERDESPPPKVRRDTVPIVASPPSGARPRKAVGSVLVAEEEFRPDRYFLKAPDADMLPRIEKGDLLLVDPGESPGPGDLVVVKLGRRHGVRQVLADHDDLLLGAANPSVPPASAKRKDVAGVIVEIRRRLR